MTEEIKIPCEVFSRIVGYLSAVQFWHKGKQEEYAERVPFKVPEEEVQNDWNALRAFRN